MPKHTSTTTGYAPRTRKPGSRAAKPASATYEAWLLERLKGAEEAAAYLEAAFEERNQPGLMLALRNVAKANGGVAAIARKSKLTREATYRMLSQSGNPALSSLTTLLAATGLQLSVKPIQRTKVRAEKTRRTG